MHNYALVFNLHNLSTAVNSSYICMKQWDGVKYKWDEVVDNSETVFMQQKFLVSLLSAPSFSEK